MSLPGFTAEASLYKTSVRYQFAETQGYSNGQTVISQLGIDPFRVSFGGGLFGDWGSWLCRFACDVAWSMCLDSCEGTIDNPKPSLNCVICDQQHQECMRGCG
jgi:hypothetical protein